MEDKRLGTWLQEKLRENPRINQTSLAYTIGVSQSAVSSWIRGVAPGPENCRRLARFFGVPADTVLLLAGHLPTRGIAVATGGSEDYTQDPEMLEVVHLFNQLGEDDQRRILAFMRTLRELEG